MTRHASQIGQIGFQGRSHDAADCGTYRLLNRVAANTWTVQWIAPCDQDPKDLGLTNGHLRFVSRAAYDRHF